MICNTSSKDWVHVKQPTSAIWLLFETISPFSTMRFFHWDLAKMLVQEFRSRKGPFLASNFRFCCWVQPHFRKSESQIIYISYHKHTFRTTKFRTFSRSKFHFPWFLHVIAVSDTNFFFPGPVNFHNLLVLTNYYWSSQFFMHCMPGA